MTGSPEWQVVAALADIDRRQVSAAHLAAHIGADALVILVEDAATEAFLPAPGFVQTLAGGAGWRQLLSLLRTGGFHRGRVGHPSAEQLRPALAFTTGGMSLVFIGDGVSKPAIEALEPALPLLASTLRAEHEAILARGELRAAKTHARESESLARALDLSRSEVERTLVQLEQQTRAADEARNRAEEAARTKDEFLAMLGHELRNPLSPILTALQLMRLKNQTSREQEVIERQVASLMRLVDDLLDVSRITRGKIDLRKERVELAEVAARAIEMASPILEKKQQVLDVRIAPTGLMLEVDPSRMAQVLSNLLTNAAKYSDAESTILFGADRVGEHVRVSVRDQGIGIAPAMLGQVFDIFVQNRQSVDRSQGGLGLGLAIVRSLVDMHGGTVRAFSEGEGHGSEFVVEIPSAPGAAAEPAVDGAAALGLQYVKTFDGVRVLVVDDNDDAAGLLAEALGALGYSVRTASDGPSGLRIASAFQPHLALLDIGLPVMDGYELAQRLREQQTAPPLRLIAVTGYGQADDRRRSSAAGFDAHLVKPITLEQLQNVLDVHRR